MVLPRSKLGERIGRLGDDDMVQLGRAVVVFLRRRQLTPGHARGCRRAGDQGCRTSTAQATIGAAANLWSAVSREQLSRSARAT